MILLHNTFIEAPHHHCFSSLPVYFLLLLLTSLRHFVLRSRFLFLLQITRSKGRLIPLYIFSFSFLFVRLLCFQSPMPKKEFVRLHQGIGSEALRRSVLERLTRSSAFSAAPSLQFSTVFMLGLPSSFHPFILSRSLISFQFVSFILSCSLIHSLLHAIFDLID